MRTEHFGYLENGQEITLYYLSNRKGMEAVFTDLGGCLVSLLVPDKDGIRRNVILGYDKLESYKTNAIELGASVGRHCNRLKGGVFEIDGKTYQLEKNEGDNNLHSGPSMWFTRRWRAVLEKDDQLGETITFYMTSPDGDQCLPGNCYTEIRYALTEENELYCEYYGMSDQDTLFNMTNHNYFNLNGDDSGDVLSHKLIVFADRWIPTDEHLVPLGTTEPVEGTPMDFRQEKEIGRDMGKSFLPFVYGHGGYDSNFEINEGKVSDTANLVAVCTGEKSGITMEMYTDRPCLALYTVNWGDAEYEGRQGHIYHKHDAFCLEAMFVPDAIHHPNFASPLLRANEESIAQTVFRFQVK